VNHCLLGFESPDEQRRPLLQPVRSGSRVAPSGARRGDSTPFVPKRDAATESRPSSFRPADEPYYPHGRLRSIEIL
jgi:hypothetical protein